MLNHFQKWVKRYHPARLLTGAIILMFGALFQPGETDAHQYFFPQVKHLIEKRVNAEILQKGFTCQGEIICGLQIIPSIYQQRDHAPVWFDARGMRPAAHALVQAIREAGLDGLIPSDYHLAAIERLMAELVMEKDALTTRWADLDLILTDAYLLLGTHLSAGRINPENIHADWLIGPRSFEMSTFLESVETQAQMHHIFDRLRPAHQGYGALKQALADMGRLADQGGWPRLPNTRRTLRLKDRDPSVAVIRRILTITEDLKQVAPDTPPNLYDADLEAAIKRFQNRHGLKPDGIIGKKTRQTLNTPVDHRISQIELNLERWRWLPNKLGQRYVLVNIAAFFLKVVEHGRNKLEMKVVVGRPARQSPVFSSTMSYLVFNPYWNVPYSIAVEDILPKLSDGVDYLIDQSFKVLNGWDKDAQELAPDTVNWSLYNKRYFPFRLRQEPGIKNALGQIKFMFPNKFAVYLHDTPQKSLFSKFQRGFSSGCIRVENAHALANYLLTNSSYWEHDALTEILEKGERRVVHLPNPITIHLLYMTAWVDENGILQFRDDIYNRDLLLKNALINRNPYPLPYQTAGGTTIRDEGSPPHRLAGATQHQPAKR